MKNKVLLTSVKDIKECRDRLVKEQEGLDAITGYELPPNKAVLDHNHDSDLVRGVVHRNANSLLGRIENGFRREMQWWYEGTIQDFLRQCADYLDLDDLEVYHSGWIKTVMVQFNKLNAAEQNRVLKELGRYKLKMNLVQRRKAMREVLTKRFVTKGEALEIIKGDTN